jgi:hypothetical protein
MFITVSYCVLLFIIAPVKLRPPPLISSMTKDGLCHPLHILTTALHHPRAPPPSSSTDHCPPPPPVTDMWPSPPTVPPPLCCGLCPHMGQAIVGGSHLPKKYKLEHQVLKGPRQHEAGRTWVGWNTEDLLDQFFHTDKAYLSSGLAQPICWPVSSMLNGPQMWNGNKLYSLIEAWPS